MRTLAATGPVGEAGYAKSLLSVEDPNYETDGVGTRRRLAAEGIGRGAEGTGDPCIMTGNRQGTSQQTCRDQGIWGARHVSAHFMRPATPFVGGGAYGDRSVGLSNGDGPTSIDRGSLPQRPPGPHCTIG